jgi:DNA-binding MarR family transcriptional regulator
LTNIVNPASLFFTTSKPHVSAVERHALAAAKQASVIQLLFKCARVLDERAIARVRERSGLTGLRTAHTSLFPHIDLEGTRLTELARRVDISKQAVAQLVDELVEMGGLERVPDPADGRAKLIRFAKRRGRLVLFDGLDVLRELESQLAVALGKHGVEVLRRLLVALESTLAE